MKKIFLALLLIAASGVRGHAGDVRVLLKDGNERKGELTVTNEDSIFIKFKTGRVRKFPFADIVSVKDEETGKDLLPAIMAEGITFSVKAPEAAKPAAPEAAPAAVTAPAAEKAPEPENVPVVKKAPAARKAADGPQSRLQQKALPDNVMAWMAERYDAKTMLGFKWEHPEKARIHYAFENDGYNYGKRSGFLARSAAGRGPSGRLDILPVSGFIDPNGATVKTNSYLEARYARAGAMASWNAGYIRYSATVPEDVFDYTTNGVTSDFTTGSRDRKTDASVVYASLLLTLPIQSFAYYGFVGPAFVSYDHSDSGSFTNDHYVWIPSYSLTTTTGSFNAKKSGTATTWIVGVGFSLRLSEGGFGIFGEYKHIPAAGSYPGMDNMSAGLSFGF